MIEHLLFHPLPGLASPHLQTIVASFSRSGQAPPSTRLIVPLEDGDALSCELSTPFAWTGDQKTILMIHGLSGSHASSYMVRLSRKFYQAGYRVLRINLRGSGSGKHLARLPYHGGVSDDIRSALRLLKRQTPLSPLIVLGFSLGGNIALKLAGESQFHHEKLIDHTIAVCPPLHLSKTTELLAHSSNRLYHSYYLKRLKPLASRWTRHLQISSIYDFDQKVTAPIWGFKSADDYYAQSSSYFYLPLINTPCQALFAEDDPFIDYKPVLDMSLPSSVKVSLCRQGGHMGFLGWTDRRHAYFWLDQLLLKWIDAV